MNLSLLDVQGEVLGVSQFTLHAGASRGRRPGFTIAAPLSMAIPLYELFKETCKKYSLTVESRVFGAMMQAELCNDGPVTIWIDSAEL
jgi:D-aminoacyl-tRNA deacylase